MTKHVRAAGVMVKAYSGLTLHCAIYSTCGRGRWSAPVLLPAHSWGAQVHRILRQCDQSDDVTRLSPFPGLAYQKFGQKQLPRNCAVLRLPLRADCCLVRAHGLIAPVIAARHTEDANLCLAIPTATRPANNQHALPRAGGNSMPVNPLPCGPLSTVRTLIWCRCLWVFGALHEATSRRHPCITIPL